jgi:ribonuclease-3
MTHASWNNERGGPSGPGHDNERLEYLGDAVLELIVGEYLFRRFPTYDEGQLTQLRAALVNTMSLARLAEKLELGSALMLGKGAAKTGAHRLPSLLANAFEAMIGAIFLDQGYRVATRVFLQNIGDLADWTDENFKGRLQEVAQERTGTTPVYRVSAVGGPGHRRQYNADAIVGGELMGSGIAATKQAAEQAAAKQALEHMRATKRGRQAVTSSASRAAGAAQRAAAGAAGDSVRVRRRIAEAAADEAASTPQAGRRKPAAAPRGDTEPAAPPSAPGRRRGGLLAALARAAEVLVGRPGAGGGAAGTATAAPAPVEQAPGAADSAAPPGAARSSRRGRRGGRGRRRPAAVAGVAVKGEVKAQAATPTAPRQPGEGGTRGAGQPRRPGGGGGRRRSRPRPPDTGPSTDV